MSAWITASIFGDIFLHLAKNPWDRENIELAEKIWNYLFEHGQFDFRIRDMNVDRALIKLGLARKIPGEINEGPEGDDHEIFYKCDEQFDKGQTSIACNLCLKAEFWAPGNLGDVFQQAIDQGWDSINGPSGNLFVCKECIERASQELGESWPMRIYEGMYRDVD